MRSCSPGPLGLRALAALFLLALPLGALVAPQGIHPADLEIRPLDYPLALPVYAPEGQGYPHPAAWNEFLAEAGGEWDLRWDRRTGLVSLVWGSGIPWFSPGTPSGPQNLVARGRPALADLESRARELVGRHPGLFGADPDDLRLNPHRSLALDGGNAWQISFGYAPGGRKVAGASLFLRFRHGRLVQFGQRHILADSPASPDPGLPEDRAVEIAREYLGAGGGDAVLVEEPELYFLPEAAGEGLAYRLVWEVVLARPGELPTWRAVVDAQDGGLVAFEDLNLYACDPALLARGRVDGGIRPQYTLDPEEIRAFSYTRVQTDAGAVTTDFNGVYDFPGGGVSSALDGEYVRVRCQGCDTPQQPFLQESITGDLHFGTGGVNTTGNGTSTVADRTTFWHANRARALGARWIPDLPWFSQNLTANTNINSSCNAFYNGAINFFRAVGNCTNTGENPGVVQHEWGHGLHVNGLDYDGSLTPTPGFDGSFSEGVGDHVDWIMDHDPRIGAGFRTNGNPVRVVDSDILGRVRTLSDSGCGGGGGYDGYEVHCGGEIWSQADWDLMELLTAQFGDVGGWYMMERLFYSAIPMAETHVPDQPHSVYDVYAFLLDDDGDLANGVPGADMLNDAYNAHEIASTPNYVEAAGSLCDPAPIAPVVVTDPRIDAAVNEYQVVVTWNDVPGASFYNLLRSENGPNHAFHPIALDLPAGTTRWVDDTVSNGRTYHYLVQTVDPNACVSLEDNVAVAVVDLAELDSLSETIADASGNGVLVPGESSDLIVEVVNLGGAQATGVSAELVSLTPGVTVDRATADYPNLAAGTSSVPSGLPFRITVDADPALCGAALAFRIFLESDQGCWDAGFEIMVGAGRSVLEADAVSFDDLPAGNANGLADPGESVDLLLDLRNSGSEDSGATTATLIPLDPRVAADVATSDYGTVAAGGVASPLSPFSIRLDPSIGCGETLAFSVLVTSDTGCWTDTFQIVAGIYEIVIADDMEQDRGWTVGDPSDTATTGIWERADPEPTSGGSNQPGSDHTPDPGVMAWVTEAAAGGRPGAGDVDDGCTTLRSPVWDLSGIAGAGLSYWRWYVNGTSPDDPFDVSISNDGGGSWQILESVPGTSTPWQQATFDLDAALGEPADQVQLEFHACDEGGGSLTEALVDDLEIGRWSCEDPDPSSRLVVAGSSVLDDVPGEGNGDGIADPGEEITLALDLENVGNMDARSVTVDVIGVGGSSRATASLATAADIGVGAVVPTDAPHLRLRLDEWLPCVAEVPVTLLLGHEDDNGSRSSQAVITVPVGRLGAQETVYFDDFEGSDDKGWIHGAVAGNDDWERGVPLGFDGDPDAAYSGIAVWATDLGGGDEGDYSADSDQWLETPPLDLGGHGDVRLRFQRWLRVEEGLYDQAQVQVDGTTVWQNPASGSLTENAWNLQEIQLPEAMGDSDVRVRFRLRSDGGLQMGGWNIDDFEVLASPMFCTQFCGGPPEGVANRLGVRRVGQDIVLDWQVSDGSRRFNIYVDADPSQLQAGVGAPVRTVEDVLSSNEGDLSLLPALTYFRVRAEDPCAQVESP